LEFEAKRPCRTRQALQDLADLRPQVVGTTVLDGQQL
jgi:hypothetical protein